MDVHYNGVEVEEWYSATEDGRHGEVVQLVYLSGLDKLIEVTPDVDKVLRGFEADMDRLIGDLCQKLREQTGVAYV